MAGISGVSDLGRLNTTQFILGQLRKGIDETQRQIGTGKKAQNFAGLGGSEATFSISLRKDVTQLETYIKNIDKARTRTNVMDKAMNGINDVTQDGVNFFRSLLFDTDPQTSIITDKADKALQTIQQRLNTRLDDRFLFAGDNIFDPPYANPGTLQTNMAAEVATLMAGTPTVGDVITAANTVNGVDLGHDPNVLTAGDVSVRSEQDVNLDYTVKSDEDYFNDILRGYSLIENLPDPTTQAEQDNFWTIMRGAMELIDEGSKGLSEGIGRLGDTQKRLEDVKSRHQETKLSFDIFVGDTEDVDIAEASTRLRSLETQLQASYRTVSLIQNLTLANFVG